MNINDILFYVGIVGFCAVGIVVYLQYKNNNKKYNNRYY